MVFVLDSANQSSAFGIFGPLATTNLIIAYNDEAFALTKGTREDILLVHQDVILANAAN
jgi:Na+-translocating ferredoxin:NAD+ oxidoreductase RnfE subunit